MTKSRFDKLFIAGCAILIAFLAYLYINNPERYLGKPRKEVSMNTELKESPRASLTPEGTKDVMEMDFYAALRELAAGKKITRKEWNDPEFYCLMRNGMLQLHKPPMPEKNRPAGEFFSWTVSDGDVAATDWRVVE
jgi:hypothetical protein